MIINTRKFRECFYEIIDGLNNNYEERYDRYERELEAFNDEDSFLRALMLQEPEEPTKNIEIEFSFIKIDYLDSYNRFHAINDRGARQWYFKPIMIDGKELITETFKKYLLKYHDIIGELIVDNLHSVDDADDEGSRVLIIGQPYGHAFDRIIKNLVAETKKENKNEKD